MQDLEPVLKGEGKEPASQPEFLTHPSSRIRSSILLYRVPFPELCVVLGAPDSFSRDNLRLHRLTVPRLGLEPRFQFFMPFEVENPLLQK